MTNRRKWTDEDLGLLRFCAQIGACGLDAAALVAAGGGPTRTLEGVRNAWEDRVGLPWRRHLRLNGYNDARQAAALAAVRAGRRSPVVLALAVAAIPADASPAPTPIPEPSPEPRTARATTSTPAPTPAPADIPVPRADHPDAHLRLVAQVIARVCPWSVPGRAAA